jgi:hypothetical protein
LWLLVAAETSAPSGVSDQLVIVVGGVITAAIVALSGVLVAIVNRSSSRTTASPPAPTGGSDLILYERTAVLARRADDADDRFDLLDKAQGTARDDLDDVLDYLDRRNPGWRP